MRIYFDHNATTPVPPPVAEAMTQTLLEDFGNASSVHHFGQRAKARLDEARSDIGRLLHAEPSEIVFTSGGTEADNLALRGALKAYQGERDGIVTSDIEHHAELDKRLIMIQTCYAHDRFAVMDESPHRCRNGAIG